MASPLLSVVLCAVLAAEVQVGATVVRHEEGAETVATRVARTLERARQSLPPFVGAEVPEVRAVLSESVEAFSARTGLPRTAAAGVVEGEVVLPPARVVDRMEDLSALARHEVAHLALLSHAGPALPRWFVEGFATALVEAGPTASGPENCRALTAELLEVRPEVRERAYVRAAALARRLAREAGGMEALWKQLSAKPDTRTFWQLRLGEKTIREHACEPSPPKRQAIPSPAGRGSG
ncbi:hypothetical protein ACN28E_46285 [Archangium lansingense]|uniref:hypothetical protein n=1 Tax=Archangium lansingense TaxID=2995310 RepID=UPI003B7B8747